MNHSYMLGHLVVLPKDKFLEWYNKVDSVIVPFPVIDTTLTDTVKTDSLKTSRSVKDSTNVPVNKNKKDSFKTTAPKDIINRKGKR